MSGVRRTVALSLVGLVLAAIAVLIGIRFLSPPPPEYSYRLTLLAAHHGPDGRTGTSPVPTSWRIGDAAPTEPAIAYEWAFHGDEPGWVEVPETLTSFQQLSDAVAGGARVAPLAGSVFTPDQEEGFLAVRTAVGDRVQLSLGSWPLWVEREDGTIDDMVVVVVRDPSGARVAKALRPMTEGRRTFAVTDNRVLDATRTGFRVSTPFVVDRSEPVDRLTGRTRLVLECGLKLDLVPAR